METIRTRPRIRLTPTPTQVGLSVFTAIGVFGTWLLLAIYYDKLPATIATHFDVMGRPDAWGGKNEMVSMPIIATAAYVLLTLIIRVPHIYNYPRPITPENAERQYGIAVAMMYWLRTTVIWLCVGGEWTTIRTGLGKVSGTGALVLPAMLLATFIPMIYCLVRMFRDK
jgi:uncharacterized membrane protein